MGNAHLLRLPLVDLLITTYRKMRPIIVAVFVITLAFVPIVENGVYKTGILISLLSMLVLLVCDAFTHFKGLLDAISKSVLELHHPGPPLFSDFPDARNHIRKSIADSMASRKDLTIQVMGMSAFYSVEFISKNLRDFLANTKGKVTLEIELTCEKTLLEHRQNKRIGKLSITKGAIRQMLADFRNEIDKDKLIIHQYDYDNLPHWHGMLINSQLFYMGRTEWDFGSKEGDPELKLGQMEYRFFTTTDNVGGNERIQRFINWFDYYRRRSDDCEE